MLFELALLSSLVLANSTVVDGISFNNLGLQGFGRIPSNARDRYGDTISFGSSVAYQKGTVQVDENGDYSFTTFNLPDRGYNVEGTVSFVSRIYKYNVKLHVVNSSSQPNLEWTLQDTILLKDFNGDYVIGLDCNTTTEMSGYTIPAVTYHGDGWGNNLNSTTTTTRLCLDSEALALDQDGFWISDEYGPGVYHFDPSGNLQEYITPPDSIKPYVNGEVDYTSNNAPQWAPYDVEDGESGRNDNRGYEGMDVSPDGTTLYALLQSAANQEGGTHHQYQYNARMMKYDLSGGAATAVAEYVFQLPTYTDPSSGNPRVAAQSEILYVSDNIFMVLARDSGLGHNQDSTESVYRHIDLFSLEGATNILGQYDGEGDSISSQHGALQHGIVPATHYDFINIDDNTELNKYGVHNGGANDDTLLNEKWEGLTLIPIECSVDEYFLLVTSDNDFTTTDGWMNFGTVSFDAGANTNNQALIYRVQLPDLPHDSVCSSSSSSSSESSSTSSSSSTTSTSSVTNSTVTSTPSETVSSTSSGFGNYSTWDLTAGPSSTEVTTPYVLPTAGFTNGTEYVNVTTTVITTCTETKCENGVGYATITVVETCTETKCAVPTAEITPEASTYIAGFTTTVITTCTETKCENGVGYATITVIEPCSSVESSTTEAGLVSSAETSTAGTVGVSLTASSSSIPVLSTYEAGAGRLRVPALMALLGFM